MNNSHPVIEVPFRQLGRLDSKVTELSKDILYLAAIVKRLEKQLDKLNQELDRAI